MYNNYVIFFVIYVCLVPEIVFDAGVERSLLMYDLYIVSIITLIEFAVVVSSPRQSPRCDELRKFGSFVCRQCR